MKLAIIGSRSFRNYALLLHAIDKFFPGENSISEVISGGAIGADSLAAEFANNFKIKLTEFLPDWEKHGKKAGFIRNEDIVKSGQILLCFWDGKSKGTGNSLSIAKRLKKPTLIIYF